MEDQKFGTTVLEQVPKEFKGGKVEPRSPWAIIIILVVIVLFGAFWLYERKTDDLSPVVPPTESLSQKTPDQTPSTNQNDSLDDIQMALVNTAIPDFSKQF